MANVKISNLPVETTLANMTGIAGYNASGTAQISGANIISGAAQPDQNLASVLATGSIATSGQTITLANSASNTSTTMGVNAISSDTSFSIIGATNNTTLTFTSGGELRFTPNAYSGTPAQGDVLAAKNVQGDVEWVTPGGSTPTLQQVLDSGNTADSNGNTGTIVLTNSAQGRTATYGNENIVTDYSFGIQATGNNNNIGLSTTDGNIGITANGTGKVVSINGPVLELNYQNTRLQPGAGSSSIFSLNNCDYLLDGYNSTSATNGGNIRINSRKALTIHTGNLATSTPGGALSLYARGNTASLSTIDGTTVGGDVTISSSSGDVIITGGENLVLTNTGLGTPTSGDYLIADGVTGVTSWFTDPKAFVTLTGSPTWVVRNGYNATWNVGAGSETLSITADDGDSGTLIVTTTTGEITWPAGSLWVGGTEPTLTNGVDVFSFIYDGTNYYWSYGQDFS